MNCPHKNVYYTEHLSTTTVWTFEDGEIADDPSNNSDHMYYVEVYCLDCKLNKKYRLIQAPQWVKRLREQIIEHGMRWEPELGSANRDRI